MAWPVKFVLETSEYVLLPVMFLAKGPLDALRLKPDTGLLFMLGIPLSSLILLSCLVGAWREGNSDKSKLSDVLLFKSSEGEKTPVLKDE